MKQTPIRQKRRKGMSLEEREQALAFKYAAMGPCAVCGDPTGSRNAHHVVYQQHLPAEHKWTPENALSVCHTCHERHHNASRRIPRECLTETNLQFASDVLKGAAGIYLARYYA